MTEAHSVDSVPDDTSPGPDLVALDALRETLHDERAAGNTRHVDCWACEAATSTAIRALLPVAVDHAMLVAIKALREAAIDERVAMDLRGEPLTDYSAGVLDGLDRAWLAARRAARRPTDKRETTSIEEWWACEDAYNAGRESVLADLRTTPAPTGPEEGDRG